MTSSVDTSLVNTPYIPAVETKSLIQSANLPSNWMSSLMANESDVLYLPFPGEPQGVDQNGRASLWRMRLLSECDANSAECPSSRFSGISEILFALLLIVAIAMCLVDVLRQPIALFMYFSLSFVCMVLMVYENSQNYQNKYFERAKARLKENSWPFIMNRVLSECVARGAALSSELKAFLSLSKDLPASKWAHLSSDDCVAMDALARSMQGASVSLSEGAVVSLSGESSELVYRVCASVTDDFNAIIHKLETPAIVKF